MSAADLERRRIERDLHDGAQQRLVSLRIQLELAGDLVEAHPERAGRRLRELGRDVDDAVDEVRSLARGLVPPILVERGIVEALRDAAQGGHLRVSVHERGLGRYPPEIESAVYFACLEALQNAAKHAEGARSASVSLWEDEELRFEVRDDGAGLPDGPTRARSGDHEHARPRGGGGRPPGDRVRAGAGHLRRGERSGRPGGAAASGGDAAAAGHRGARGELRHLPGRSGRSRRGGRLPDRARERGGTTTTSASHGSSWWDKRSASCFPTIATRPHSAGSEGFSRAAARIRGWRPRTRTTREGLGSLGRAVDVSAAPLGGGRLVLTWHDVTRHTRLEEQVRLQSLVLDRATEGVCLVRAVRRDDRPCEPALRRDPGVRARRARRAPGGRDQLGGRARRGRPAGGTHRRCARRGRGGELRGAQPAKGRLADLVREPRRRVRPSRSRHGLGGGAAGADRPPGGRATRTNGRFPRPRLRRSDPTAAAPDR